MWLGWGAILVVFMVTAARAESVDVAVVLAADVSRSIDNDEFKLQRRGYAEAITNPRTLAAIRAGARGAIALCYVEWSGPDEQRVIAPWTVIRDGESAASFAALVESAPRAFVGTTSLSAAIQYAAERFAESGVEADRRVIDISGDGTNNSGRAIRDARDAVVKEGIIINGLAIINDHPAPGFAAHTQPPEGLPAYFSANVIGGPGSFLRVMEDFAAFGEAMTSKLVGEIALGGSREQKVFSA